MPPLAYRRMHRTPNHRALELAGLHPALRRTDSLYVNREISRPKSKPKTWPAILIERSTRIYGKVPSIADDYIRGYQGRTTRPDYFFERSEVAISPIIDDIFRGKRYSIKNLFNDLSMKTVSKSLSGFRFRRDSNDGEEDDEKSNDSPQTENNYSRLLRMLARGRVQGRSEYDADSARNFHRRSKRHVAHEDKDVGGKVRAEEKLNNDADGETEASQKKRRIKTFNEGNTEVTRKHRYTPVFKDCNDTTAASEVADLNAPPPPTPPPQQRRATLREYYRNGGNIQDIDLTWNKKTARNENKYDDDSKIPLTTIPPAVEEDEEEPAQKEAVSTTKNETYINLQDHQKDVQVGMVPKDSNGYPVDIPAYNPDAIPYVDVPDYSDQREESLDKDDRKIAKEKYVEYPDEEADVIDPELVLTNNGRRSEKIIVRDEDVQEPEEVKEEVEEEGESDEEGTEKSPFTGLADESDENKEKENEETISKNVRSDATDDSYDFGPIHFDIEEYKKPFNLEELFKDIEKEVEEKNATKGDVNEHQGSKNIPVRGDSNEAKGSYKPLYWDDGDFKAFESPLVKTRGDKLTEKNVANNEEKNSPQDSTLVPPNFFEEFDRVFGPSASDKPFFADYFREDEEEKGKEERLPVSSSSLIKNDDYAYRDENTYENLFATDSNRNKSKSESKTTKDNDADDYYKKYSDHDVTDFLEEKKAEAEVEEPYKTLATILDKKDDISRLDDEISTKAKMEGKVPNKYNNFWTLEYGSPDRSEKT